MFCGNFYLRKLIFVACEQQTHFRSSLLSLRKIIATTGNASAVRRPLFLRIPEKSQKLESAKISLKVLVFSASTDSHEILSIKFSRE